MTVQHKHLIVRAEVRKPPNDQKWAHTWLTELVSKIGMQICQGPITTYLDIPSNKGLKKLISKKPKNINRFIVSQVQYLKPDQST